MSILMLGAAGRAHAAVTVGETFTPAAGPCSDTSWVAAASAAFPAAQFTTPTAGVITSWSFQAPPTVPATITFKTAKATGGSNFTTTGRGSPEVPVANQLNTFATRVSVQAGETIGYALGGGPLGQCVRAASGYSFGHLAGDPGIGVSASYAIVPSDELDVSARLEPDADNDEYGDETQDQCPSDATTHGICPDLSPPETTIDLAPSSKTTKKQATFAFSSPRSGSTFECGVDGAGLAPCTSPRILTVGTGDHIFTVRATSPLGVVDPTPATATWTVKKKKKKHHHHHHHHHG